LTMLQGMMDEARFVKFNCSAAEQLVDRLRNKDLATPFRVDFLSGRKRNRRAFHTNIYHDALAAWKKYFDQERGWPKPGQPIAVTRYGPQVSRQSIRDSFDTIAIKLHYKPKPGHDPAKRTGVGPHEAFRDVVKSRLQTAKKKGFDMTCTDFWMGHRIDPYNYNKFTELEPEYLAEQARIAADYLNIITGPAALEGTETSRQNEQLRIDLAKVREDLAQLRGEFRTAFKAKTTDAAS
jgi:hypothetical protein